MQPVLNTIELFCGKAEFSKTFKKQGHRTFSVDIRKRSGVCEPDLRINIMNLTRALLPQGKINIVYAAVPCTAFSHAAGNKYFSAGHFNEDAKMYLELFVKTTQLITELNPDFYVIENPRGHLRSLESLKKFIAATNGVIRDCKLSCYGFATVKPTQFFTNAHFLRFHNFHSFGRGNKNPSGVFSNMTVTQRQATPEKLFAHMLSQFSDFYSQNLSNSYGSQLNMF
jgi:hypothetical protein